jgi:hypothetical protein
MIGRRTAALLCVLLMHALVIFALMDLKTPEQRELETEFSSEPITIDLPQELPAPAPSVAGAQHERTPRAPRSTATVATPPAAASSAITPPERVDWPIEGKKAVTRVLAAEAEAERIAKMFSGPGGTWASLTKRERSRLKKFRWKPGVAGLEYDSQGNQIYHISEGCVVVNSMFIGCAIGKAKVHGDLLKDMRLYFDEQRLPPLDDGNGTEDPQRR